VSVWQVIIVCLMAAAFFGGRPPLRVMAVMVCNLLFSMHYGDSFLWVGIADVVSAALLLGASMRANIVAGLFAAMVPVYVAATYFGWNVGTTYTIIDLLAYAQLGVIGNVDGGVGYIRRFVARRRGGSPVRYLAGGRAIGGSEVVARKTSREVI